MASGPLVVGDGGGGDSSREKHRWSESKVYTRKGHSKNPKATTIDGNNANNGSNPLSSQQTLATADDLNSSLRQPPPPLHPLPLSPPSGNDASSLNHDNHRLHPRTITISLASRSRHELRELRRKLSSELEQVRALSRRLASEFAPTHTVSQFSASDPRTPVPAKRPPPPSKSKDTSLRRHISVSVPPGENSATDTIEKEKRTPKANQYYRNSDFILGKEKIPPPDSHSHKKAKANGSRKGDADYGLQTVDKKLFAQAFKSCSSLLANKLMKHPHGWVFNTPVDVKGLGLHDYHTIIKQPMDLGTIKSRLTKNWYKSPREFAEDVRLTFQNAMTYNPKGQDVHVMAEQLSQLFEERWPAIESEYTYLLHPPTAKKAPRPPPLDVRTLERSDSTIHPVAESKTKPVNHTPQFGRSPALKKPKAKDLHKRDMTFEEKQRLSNNLQNLPPEKLDNIVQIIKKRNLAMSQHDDEIEVDIDSVDVETLWELDRFVTNYKKSLSKNKRKAELASLRRAEADHSRRERMQETLPEAVATEAPKESKTVVDEKDGSSSSPNGRLKKNNDASQSDSSNSSTSGSSSSSSDSDSDSSSAYGSDGAHSPRT